MHELLGGFMVGFTISFIIRLSVLRARLFRSEQELFWSRQHVEAVDKVYERERRWRERALARRVATQ